MATKVVVGLTARAPAESERGGWRTGVFRAHPQRDGCHQPTARYDLFLDGEPENISTEKIPEQDAPDGQVTEDEDGSARYEKSPSDGQRAEVSLNEALALAMSGKRPFISACRK